jgi:phage head maturation protease
MSEDHRALGAPPRRRADPRVQVRDASGTGDGSWTIEGYAAVYEQETTLYDIPGWIRVREEIARGAFTDVLERLARGDGSSTSTTATT